MPAGDVRTSSRVQQRGGRSMKSHRMNRTRKYFRPGVESLEGRCLLSGMGPLAAASPAAAVDVLTHHNDVSPTGANPNQTPMTPHTLTAAALRKLSSST